MRTSVAALLVVCSAFSMRPANGAGDADRVVPNDNRRPAGTLRGATLTLALEARVADWHPDGDSTPGTPIQAFAEEGKAAQIPGPLMRVRTGTEVVLSLRNALKDTLAVRGFFSRPAPDTGDIPAFVVAPGERREVRFRLDTPGTYSYWGTSTKRAVNFRHAEDSQLTGVIVVDDSSGSILPDRIFVLGMYADTVHRAMTRRNRILGTINGRSWPATERLDYGVGDTVRWRIVNGSADLHPVHLHGFFFRVDARGAVRRDVRFPEEARPLAVTESLGALESATITWVPERAGNWLFHCHVPEHFAPRGPLGTAPTASASHGDHTNGGMNGMVMGVAVRRHSGDRVVTRKPDDSSARRIRLLVRPNVGSTDATPLYGYGLHEGGNEPPADTGLHAAPTLDLEQGRPVRITVVNRLPEPTAVHWHGIELESYYDGVPGFSGEGRSVTPLIAPGDSFDVRFTPPREGTFIYHTHADEVRQQLAGLAGAIVVAPPGVRRDSTRDIPVILAAPTRLEDQGRVALVNGSARPAPLVVHVGTTYRLRLIQMSTHRAALRVDLLRDTSLVSWSLIAKDGAARPLAMRSPRPSTVFMGVGEAYDYEFTPDREGTMRIEVQIGGPWPARAVVGATWPIEVRPSVP